ncbi:MAG TPA: hypothetical protein VN711_05300, partial [Candidatus Saccharimonadales bacterium]|nr:hypothetical protein [Candidatus Saccharimonadales bacterium]
CKMKRIKKTIAKLHHRNTPKQTKQSKRRFIQYRFAIVGILSLLVIVLGGISYFNHQSVLGASTYLSMLSRPGSVGGTTSKPSCHNYVSSSSCNGEDFCQTYKDSCNSSYHYQYCRHMNNKCGYKPAPTPAPKIDPGIQRPVCVTKSFPYLYTGPIEAKLGLPGTVGNTVIGQLTATICADERYNPSIKYHVVDMYTSIKFDNNSAQAYCSGNNNNNKGASLYIYNLNDLKKNSLTEVESNSADVKNYLTCPGSDNGFRYSSEEPQWMETPGGIYYADKGTTFQGQLDFTIVSPADSTNPSSVIAGVNFLGPKITVK